MRLFALCLAAPTAAACDLLLTQTRALPVEHAKARQRKCLPGFSMFQVSRLRLEPTTIGSKALEI